MLWLAGYLEGEGSFQKGPPSKPNQPLITCQTTDFDIVEEVGKFFRTKPIKVKKRQKHWKQSWAIRIRGLGAVKIMKELFPFMGKRRKVQIEKAISSYKDKRKRIIPKEDYREIVNKLSSGESSAIEIANKYKVTKWAIYRLRERYLGL